MAARKVVSREPNQRLEALLHEAGISNAGLARRVNIRGSQRGLNLRHDKTSVSRWVRGQRPRIRTAVIIAEVLSEKLDRTVSLDEIGMAYGKSLASNVGLKFAPDLGEAIQSACELWSCDADPRGLVFGPTVAVSTLIGPSRDWLITACDAEVSREGGSQVHLADVEAVRETTLALSGLDRSFGGGHTRSVAVHYLNVFVSGLLSGTYTETVGRSLFAAIAQLAKHTGLMTVDTGRPSLAQRYYIQALRLAQAAGDRALGGFVLADGMSTTAPLLGHPREVVPLALAARGGTGSHTTPSLEALFHLAEARGHALLGDAFSCERSADLALETFDDTSADGEHEWLADFTAAHLADGLAHCYRDLGRPAESARWAQTALDGLPRRDVRRRAIDLLLLATARAEAGEVTEGCHHALRALELLGGLRSHLGMGYLSDFRGRLQRNRDSEAQRAFEARMADSATTLGRQREGEARAVETDLGRWHVADACPAPQTPATR
ncbi:MULTISPECIES: helix-turn-helix transcriptional regulator [unclassified Streptomyces]|uniref:helix-turn-helix domain-containing protein n=1 Tax=unclassified Streptomyces TaxID=2593676 RepID=UPI000ABEDFC5|nr:helix-turn-helix transcriptional regulator [Streptomyces sp. CNQ-509]